MLEFTGASRLVLELLAQLVQQLCQAGVGSGHHPAMRVVHGDLRTDMKLSQTVERLLYESKLPRG